MVIWLITGGNNFLILIPKFLRFLYVCMTSMKDKFFPNILSHTFRNWNIYFMVTIRFSSGIICTKIICSILRIKMVSCFGEVNLYKASWNKIIFYHHSTAIPNLLGTWTWVAILKFFGSEISFPLRCTQQQFSVTSWFGKWNVKILNNFQNDLKIWPIPLTYFFQGFLNVLFFYRNNFPHWRTPFQDSAITIFAIFGETNLAQLGTLH